MSHVSIPNLQDMKPMTADGQFFSGTTQSISHCVRICIKLGGCSCLTIAYNKETEACFAYNRETKDLTLEVANGFEMLAWNPR